MGKHEHNDPNAEGNKDQRPIGGHSTVSGYPVGNQDPNKRGLGNAEGHEPQR